MNAFPVEGERDNPGCGRVRFECVAGRTAAVELFAASPLKFLQPATHCTAAWVVSTTYGGGLLGGDRIEIKVNAGPGTRAVLSTQASTKVYRSEEPALQTLECDIGADALFVSAPERVACFAGSSLRQTQRFRLAASASLVAVDYLSAGRSDSGESWQFDSYASRIEIWREARLLMADALVLDHEHGSIAERMRRFRALATVVLCGPLVAETVVALRAGVDAGALERRGNVRIGISPLGDDGALLRIASVDVETLGSRVRECLQPVCGLLGTEVWSRRI